MRLPKGIKEEEFLTVLEKAVADATRNFTIAYYEIEDLKQEARCFALEAVLKFKATKGSLYTFLRTHIHNRLINLKRDIEFRSQSPCYTCPYHSADTSPYDREGCGVYNDRSECVKWMKWMRTNISKKSLAVPSPNVLEGDLGEIENDEIVKQELRKLISHQIPNSLRSDYLKMMDGITIPIKRRQKVLDTLKKILIKEGETDGGE